MSRPFVSAAAALLLPTLAVADPGTGSGYEYGPGMMWTGGTWGGFGMVLGPLVMILLLVGVVALTVHLVRGFGASGPKGPEVGDRALSILRERLAKGEIDAAEFEERRKALAQ